jgi:hypothetical protein
MKVFVLGVDHELQRTDGLRSPAMKQQYRDLLNRIIDEHHVQFLCEEANPCLHYVGQEVSVSRGLPHEWKNIDMPQEVREQLGIHEEQSNRAPEPRLGKIKSHIGDDGYYSDYKDDSHVFVPRVPSDAVREQYMFERALEGAGNANSILVLCGHLHAPEVAKRFTQAGHAVTLDMLHNYDWYSPI